ncbi:MAG TPA: hypothetical protein VFI03_08810 [Solirubrobacterales bacterium]|nr:hypothetical protein [Solirubrobacterales bacterium]
MSAHPIPPTDPTVTKETLRMHLRLTKIALATIAAALCLVALSATATASAAPRWDVEVHHSPTSLEPGGPGEYYVYVRNLGDAPSEGEVTLTIELPTGMVTRPGFPVSSPFITTNEFLTGWECGLGSFLPGASTLTCTRTTPVPVTLRPAGLPIDPVRPFMFFVTAPPIAGTAEVKATVAGGGSGSVTATESTPIDTDPVEFGMVAETLKADAYDAGGVPVRQAGAHPREAVFSFDMNTAFKDGPTYRYTEPQGSLRDVEVLLPRGLVGDPQAVPQCTPMELQETVGPEGTSCPTSSQVGVADITLEFEGPATYHLPVYNMVPPKGAVADFGFALFGGPVHILAELDPANGYTVKTTVENINETGPVRDQRLTLWGVPGDPAHDNDRFNPLTGGFGASSTAPRKPFITLPSECGVDGTSKLRLFSWQGLSDPELGAPPYESVASQVHGCEKQSFRASLEALPDSSAAASPTGLSVDLAIDQDLNPSGLGTPPLKKAVVTLPEGMTVNPASASGLSGCSMEELGISASGVPNGEPVRCPDSAKIGALNATTPVLAETLEGSVYLAEQDENPFDSLLALYLVIENPERGLLVKLAGKVETDPSTGRLTTTFEDNPQLPVSSLKLRLKSGSRAPLITPSSCGTYTTKTELTSWSGQVRESSSSFTIDRGPDGRPCPSGEFEPSFEAGTMSPIAGEYSPLLIRASRSDGSQTLRGLRFDLPAGLTGKLAGIPYCPQSAIDAAGAKSGRGELASASCPQASKIGIVNVGAGAGSTPFGVQGNVYLAGPYKGAPLSAAVVTPAVAGPFDLGTVVVRAALQVDPSTTQIHAVSDPIPSILQGIPLQVRSIEVNANRSQFTLNPTSCDPMSIESTLLGAAASKLLSSHFQVGACEALPFKPKLKLKVTGATRRGQFPKLRAELKAKPGEAGIGRVSVALPHSEFLAQSHIRTICTRVQYAADTCPAGSIYGKARAFTPLLDQPLEGPVYLRSSSNPLPDLVIALKGQIDVDLVGRIDSVNGGIRSTFETVPDAPLSKFVLEMLGGRKSLLENSRNLCEGTNRATVRMDGQNGRAFDARPVLGNSCGKARKTR